MKAILTRRLSYRKNDRAMRPIYGCPEKFWESLTRPDYDGTTTATFPNILMGFFSDRSYEYVNKI